jgi:hypothetical protein
MDANMEEEAAERDEEIHPNEVPNVFSQHRRCKTSRFFFSNLKLIHFYNLSTPFCQSEETQGW